MYKYLKYVIYYWYASIIFKYQIIENNNKWNTDKVINILLFIIMYINHFIIIMRVCTLPMYDYFSMQFIDQ